MIEYLTEESQRINPFMLAARLDMKPLSANKMFTLRRHRTADYNRYAKRWGEKLSFASIPLDIEEPKLMLFRLELKAGLSTKAADLDNVIKPLLDCITDNLTGFDDKQVQEIHAYREAVPKASEYIEFILTQIFREGT